MSDSKLLATTHFPSPLSTTPSTLSEEEKIGAIAGHMRSILELLGLDLSDASIAKTPQRVAKMYVKELFAGLNLDAFPAMTFLKDLSHTPSSERMVIIQVRFTSMCEHHLIPMVGTAYIGYIPNKRLLGLSKFARVVRYFARRPQLQERLNAQINDALTMLLQTEDVAVALIASHFCMVARGVEDHTSMATTHVLRGRFKDDLSLRESFLSTLNSTSKCC